MIQVSKKLINLFRHGSLPRDNDGAIEFWRKKISSESFCVLSSLSEETRQDFISVLILQEQFCISELSKVLQDAILSGQCRDSGLFFKYIHHVGCAINLHSIISSGLTSGGQHLSERQSVFFLLVNPMERKHKDLETIDLGAPRLAPCKKH